MKTKTKLLTGCLLAVSLTTVAYGCKGKANNNGNTADTVATAKPPALNSMPIQHTLSRQHSAASDHAQ